MSQAFGLNARSTASQHEFSSAETAEDVGNDKTLKRWAIVAGPSGTNFAGQIERSNPSGSGVHFAKTDGSGGRLGLTGLFWEVRSYLMAHRVCPWWVGYFLASPVRRWLQDPGTIVGPFVTQGMVVLEPGPGMGFFTLDLARRVGPNGRVIAVDVQSRMLEGLKKRAAKAGLAERIDARLCKPESLGIDDYERRVDFALAFAMVHEVPNPSALFKDIHTALKHGGKLLFAEPTGHVPRKAFEDSLERARKTGFLIEPGPNIPRFHSAVLSRTS